MAVVDLTVADADNPHAADFGALSASMDFTPTDRKGTRLRGPEVILCDVGNGRHLVESRNHGVPTLRDPIARPPRGERSLSSGDFHPPQFVARNFVLFERSLIGGVRRTLGGEHTRSRTASYTFGED